MHNAIGIDFGTSNTLITVWDPLTQHGRCLSFPDYCRNYTQGTEHIPLIPSVIHYAPDHRRWIGNQVFEQGLYGSNRTMRWMKRYISQRSPYKLMLDGQEMTPSTAARDFLSTLLVYAKNETHPAADSIGMSVPVEAFEHYENWLTTIIHEAGFSSFRLIDEPSAAALGYGEHIQPGSVYLIFDFGGGTLHAGVVIIEDEKKGISTSRCRVLGKAGRDIGGSSIDRWLFEYVLSSFNLSSSDDVVRQVSNQLLVNCELAKEKLTTAEETTLLTGLPQGNLQLTRSQFESILDDHNLFVQINQTIRSALNKARERGFGEDAIQSVLLIGGSSQIPSVRRTIEQSFGRERVRSGHPMDAVALGAARLAGGADFYDFIQHDYAIRYTNPETGEYAYKTIIEKGTAYPSNAPEASLIVKASYTGQEKLGITIFEMSGQSQENKESFELIFDPEGYASMMPLTSLQKDQRQLFWMNENSPTFIQANPAAEQGDPRFEVKFLINQHKQLVLSVYDIKISKIILDQIPVVKLA
jgi:molecular chaperone DnaK